MVVQKRSVATCSRSFSLSGVGAEDEGTDGRKKESKKEHNIYGCDIMRAF